jgi:ribosomal protein S18 acetylase RimI-like enzyme
MDDTKLDNPVWHSLCESHHQFAVEYPHIKFYHPDYCPFGGFDQVSNISNSIEQYSSLIDNFFIVGEKPDLSSSLKIKKELVCLQMVINGRINSAEKDNIVKLTDQHSSVLYELVNLVQPGYFRKKTSLLGEYFGIFEVGQLVAVAGERMSMNDFTEVSAIVTHPEHTGKGYAKQLVAHVVNAIFDKNKTPFLHVAETNLIAIRLYEKSGFTVRRKISFWNIIK